MANSFFFVSDLLFLFPTYYTYCSTIPVCDLQCSMVAKLGPPSVSDLQGLQHNDRAVFRWVWGVKAKDGIASEDLLAKLHLVDATIELRTRRLR